MRERPILFSGPMIRALLAGTKTQTRRVLKQATGPSLSVGIEDDPGVAELSWLHGDGPGYDVHETVKRVRCPHGRPGDRLWVREAFSGPYCMERTDDLPAMPPGQWPAESPIWYWADGEPTHGDWTRPRPSIHMPRWASRILLEVTAVRVERLQDISETDALAEGVSLIWPDGPRSDLPGANHYTIKIGGVSCNAPTAAGVYRMLWESINGAGSWAANPFVWVVEFKRATQ